MKMLSILCCLGVLALPGCSSKPAQPPAKAADVATPFDAMKADEQRARDVQKVVDQHAAEQRKQIEAQAQ